MSTKFWKPTEGGEPVFESIKGVTAGSDMFAGLPRCGG